MGVAFRMNTTNMKIMIVDDHELIRKGIKCLIRRRPDIEVVGEAENGGKAVLLARQLKPDVIITDFKMPGMNGIEASQKIMDEDPGIKILLMSACLNIHVIEQALKAGILGLMSKESLANELVDAIGTVQKGHEFCCPKVIQMLQKHTLADCKNRALAEVRVI